MLVLAWIWNDSFWDPHVLLISSKQGLLPPAEVAWWWPCHTFLAGSIT
jgi:hypothetical protein